MITCLQMITDALRLVNIIDMNQVPDAEQAQSGMRSLNQMMADAQADGINLGWVAITSLSENLYLEDADERAVKYNFAVELSGEYGIAPPDVVLTIAKVTYARVAKSSALYVQCDMSGLPIEAPYGSLAWPIG